MFLSDVPGLMRDPRDAGTLIREIGAGELAKLEKEGVIGGGMIPKCRSAAAALRQGLKKVEFVDGRVAGTLTKVVKSGGEILFPNDRSFFSADFHVCFHMGLERHGWITFGLFLTEQILSRGDTIKRYANH